MQVSVDFLPDSLKEMIPEIGFAGVQLLVEKCGGMAFKHLPSEPGPDHPLVQLLGMDLAAQLCQIHARCDLYIPRAKKALDAVRDSQIIARFDANATISELVQEFGLSERWIRTIINRPDPRQLTLDLQ